MLSLSIHSQSQSDTQIPSNCCTLHFVLSLSQLYSIQLKLFCIFSLIWSRDVMQFEFNNERFQQIRISMNILIALLSNANSRKNSLFYDSFHTICTDIQRAPANFLSNSTYHTNYSYWMCSIIFAQWCVTLYWYGHWFYWLWEITLLHYYLVDINQCIMFQPIK